MANPNLTTASLAAAVDILLEAQLGTGNTDAVVPTGKAWKLASGTVCNTSAAVVTVTVSVLKTSGGTARRAVSAYPLGAGDSLDLSPYLPQVLPEGATLRATASAATAIDMLVAGTVLG